MVSADGSLLANLSAHSTPPWGSTVSKQCLSRKWMAALLVWEEKKHPQMLVVCYRDKELRNLPLFSRKKVTRVSFLLTRVCVLSAPAFKQRPGARHLLILPEVKYCADRAGG